MVFGDYAKKLHISSTKSMTGHMIGAAGAIEALFCVKAINDSFIPPTINLDNPDIENGCDLDYTPNVGISLPITATASCSLGFGGHNACLVITKYMD
jgi:3-oxoacyl-[acyl-carrier-protein] synthase II